MTQEQKQQFREWLVWLLAENPPNVNDSVTHIIAHVERYLQSPETGLRWVKGTVPPNDKEDRPIKVEDLGYYTGWYNPHRNLWATDSNEEFHPDSVMWLSDSHPTEQEARLQAVANTLSYFIEADGSPVDGFRFRELAKELKEISNKTAFVEPKEDSSIQEFYKWMRKERVNEVGGHKSVTHYLRIYVTEVLPTL